MILLFLFFQQESPSDEEVFSIETIPQQPNEQVNSETVSELAEEPAVKKIMVDVKGAVLYPGVYELTTDHRIVDAIKAAGGYTEEAQNMSINHAQKLQDEMAIYVPKKGEEAVPIQNNGQVVTGAATASESGSEQVDLNHAEESALTTIPGIGPSKAQAIIAYREENGQFKTIEELKNVSGIGDKTFEKLKEHITVK
ncbi:helix-hairpin-helix domain-containing protein [Lysinibacillus yapensis]|uniref:helix-hairpin-helix domain-containing protein n=1 Tax=Ureibacillus yapensis TaxID=2304605 RepID=UPI001F1C274E|nr:helix-hairpin-helix domain-containing protein [Lysinibacillus yapensis]